MKNVLHLGPWKRLTFALVLAAAASVIVPASPANAIRYQYPCSWNQSTIITYYSDPLYENATCSDVLYPCPGYSATHYCDGSETPYSKTVCNSCPLQ